MSAALRVAFIGKGGAGKSTIVGTFARLLARRLAADADQTEVVAVDSDPMPGLSFSLGVPSMERPIPDDAVVEKADGGDGARYRLRPGLDAVGALRAYAPAGPDGVRFLSFGKTGGEWGDIARGQFAWSQILNELPADGFALVGDLPGGTRQPMFGWGKYADVMVVVVEPTAKSIATARRLARVKESRFNYSHVVAVVNRVLQPGDAADVTARCGLEVIGSVPFDHDVAAADRLGLAPLDAAPAGAFVAAVNELVAVCLTRFASDSKGAVA